MHTLSLIISLLVLGLSSGKPFYGFGNDAICAGYKACPATDDKKINVHMIPHSHDDTGWTKTLDQYYYKNVQSVIGSVVLALKQNPLRRFIQVETAYFKLWWQDQSDAVKKDVINLINEGRLEIVGGAWSMNDEAATHYQSTIDQFTLGLKYMENNLGKCARPKTGWQIDPFGHSKETASLFSQMGFDSIHFARIDFRDKAKRATEKRMEMLWQGSDSLGEDSNIFANVFKNHYHAPDGFCFDVRCNDAPIVTDEESPEYNLEKRVNEFVEVVKGFADIYDNNQVLITFGADMRWEGAMKNYINLEKLMEGFKKFKPKINGKEINLIYSTPTCYTKSVNDYVKKYNKILDQKTDDFFPHADGKNSVWAGYFTSRPTSKRYERSSNNLVQVSKQIKALAGLPVGTTTKLEEALGVMQHHDAITGTEKAAVEKDYHRAIHRGAEEALNGNNIGLSKLLGSSSDLNLKSCDLLNISICDEANKDEFNVVLWNPLSRSVSHYIQIPVNNGQWQVTDPDGKIIENHVTDNVRDFSYAAKALKAHYLEKTLFFKAENLPPLGYKTYHFKKTGSESLETKVVDLSEVDQMGFLSNYVNFDKVTGLIKSVTLANVTIDVKQQLMYYKSHDGNSGAYLFRPKEGSKDAQVFSDKVDSQVKVIHGELIREVRQTWKNWATQIVRIYKEEDFIELDWIVGPIDVSDNVGKEIISRFSTSLKTNGEFYTDANGREMIKRKRNFRETYDYTNEEPQAGNYYPVTSKITIKDSSKQFSILNDRAQGGSSLKDGEVELMLHRAVLKDDGKGVGENLNEMEFDQGLVARGSLYLTVGNVNKGNDKKSINAIERSIAQRKQLAPWVFFTNKDVPKKSQSFLKKSFPENVHLLTLDKWNDDELLIRLEHFIPLNEDPNLSKEVTVDLTDAFTIFDIKSMEEYTLAGNTPLKELSRLEWPQLKRNLSKSSPLRLEVRKARDSVDLKIKLAPMQIRTFRAKVVRK